MRSIKRLISGILGAIVGLGGVSAKTKKNTQDNPSVNKTLTKRSKKIRAKAKKNKIKRDRRIIGARIDDKASGVKSWSTKKKAFVGVGAIGAVGIIGSAAAAIYNKDKIKMYLVFRKLRGGTLDLASEYSEGFRGEVSKFLDEANDYVRFRSCDVVVSGGFPKCEFVFDLKEMAANSVSFFVYIEDKKLTRDDLLSKIFEKLYVMIASWLSSRCPASVSNKKFVVCVVSCLALNLDLSSVASELKNKGIEFVDDI